LPNALASLSDAFEVSKPYTLLDQNTIVSSGRVIVKEFDQKEGSKIQLSEGVDFWEKVGGLNLRDLDLHGDDFEFTTTNMNTLKTLGSSVFLTALHDARGDQTNTALTNYNYTRPFYRFRMILDAIATQVGYSIDYGDLLSTTELNLIGCASNADRFWFSDYKEQYEDIAVNGAVPIGTGTILFNLGNVSLGGGQIDNDIYKTSYILKGRVNAAQDSIVRFVFSDRTESFAIPKGVSDINFLTDESDIGTTLEIETDSPVTFEDVYLYDAVSESEIFDVDGAVTAVIGFYVLADYNLPNMTCKDFIKMLMKLFFLNPHTDNDSRVITFTKFEEDLNTNNFIDLSGRVQRNNSWTTGDIFGKTNYLGYVNDKDIDLDLGRSTFKVDNVNAADVKDIIVVSEFSASKEFDVSGERIVSYPIYNTVDPKRESVAQRIVYFNEVGAFGFNATFAEISFQRLQAKYYFSFIENTTRERVVSLEVLLKFHEFMDIQQRPLIYNPDLGGLFLVTEIDKYTNEGLTVLNCIKYG